MDPAAEGRTPGGPGLGCGVVGIGGNRWDVVIGKLKTVFDCHQGYTINTYGKLWKDVIYPYKQSRCNNLYLSNC